MRTAQKKKSCMQKYYLSELLFKNSHLKDEGFLIDSCLSFLTGSWVALSSYGVSDKRIIIKKDLVFLQLSER